MIDFSSEYTRFDGGVTEVTGHPAEDGRLALETAPEVFPKKLTSQFFTDLRLFEQGVLNEDALIAVQFDGNCEMFVHDNLLF